MDIQIDAHTLRRAEERGTNEVEIRDAILTGEPIPAREGRLARAKVYPYGRVRNGKRYAQKRVEVFFVKEDHGIVTVTVYVFYGKWR